jgi:hypothetical protein
MLESQLERKLVEWCRKEGILTYKFSSPSHRGVPDRIFLYEERTMFLELKRAGNKPTALQLRELATLQEAGFAVGWTDDIANAKLALLRFKNGVTPSKENGVTYRL